MTVTAKILYDANLDAQVSMRKVTRLLVGAHGELVGRPVYQFCVAI
jgi:hypothetical protein